MVQSFSYNAKRNEEDIKILALLDNDGQIVKNISNVKNIIFLNNVGKFMNSPIEKVEKYQTYENGFVMYVEFVSKSGKHYCISDNYILRDMVC